MAASYMRLLQQGKPALLVLPHNIIAAAVQQEEDSMATTHSEIARQAEEFLTTKQVSKHYGPSEDTLRYWRYMGRGPASFLLGRKVFYRRSECERWIAEQEAATLRGGVA